ncbi:MAG TPA: TIM barrel protein [Blastocatellia bacterium]|nr:TIM barrel protein [Blastocatellia bacterium]
MGISVGNAPVSWGIMEVEGWNGQQPWGEVMDEIARAGYDGTELGPYGYFPTEPERLRQELSARRLRLVTAFVPVPLARPEAHEAGFQEALKTARLLADAGAHMILLADEMSRARMAIAGRAEAKRDGMNAEQWHGAAQIVTRIAEACLEMGIVTAFHHHAGTFVETPAEIARLCESTDENLLGLCLDTGHYFYGGGDPVEAARQYGSRIWHLHLKDVRPAVLDAVRRDGTGFLDAVRRGVFCELGQGGVDFPQVIGRLTDAGFTGWAIVEQDTDVRQEGVNPYASAVRSRQYLRQTIGI